MFWELSALTWLVSTGGILLDNGPLINVRTRQPLMVLIGTDDLARVPHEFRAISHGITYRVQADVLGHIHEPIHFNRPIDHSPTEEEDAEYELEREREIIEMNDFFAKNEPTMVRAEVEAENLSPASSSPKTNFGVEDEINLGVTMEQLSHIELLDAHLTADITSPGLFEHQNSPVNLFPNQLDDSSELRSEKRNPRGLKSDEPFIPEELIQPLQNKDELSNDASIEEVNNGLSDVTNKMVIEEHISGSQNSDPWAWLSFLGDDHLSPIFADDPISMLTIPSGQTMQQVGANNIMIGSVPIQLPGTSFTEEGQASKWNDEGKRPMVDHSDSEEEEDDLFP